MTNLGGVMKLLAILIPVIYVASALTLSVLGVQSSLFVYLGIVAAISTITLLRFSYKREK